MDDHIGSGFREAPDDPRSDASARAGHDHGFSREVEEPCDTQNGILLKELLHQFFRVHGIMSPT